MSPEIQILAVTAATLGFVHTITGPDHYLPFIVIGRARNWRLGRTLTVTALCGLGHVLSSVVLGLIGVALGVAVGRLELIEGMRGDLAAWALISFGLIYAVWGLRRAHLNKPHTHRHVHADGSAHTHHHHHQDEHGHVHEEKSGSKVTPWALFIIFVLGPCEPLIPILMYPAANHSVAGMVWVATIFSVVTIGTMLGMVLLAERGIRLVNTKPLERYVHALAGGTICASGLAIKFLGL